MDYSGFKNFPFPEGFTQNEQGARDYFMQLPDDVQLEILHGCKTYDDFVAKVKDEMKKE